MRIGEILLARGEVSKAKEMFESARPLFERSSVMLIASMANYLRRTSIFDHINIDSYEVPATMSNKSG